MEDMSDEIERRLAAAAEALREYEVTGQRRADLTSRAKELKTELARRRVEHAGEQADVDKLEGMSLTRVVAALSGSRNDRLARERAEADAARYRLAEAQARLDALGRELAAAQARLDQLATAPADFAAVLDEKERASGDPRLLQLAEERGRLTAELRELGEASRAADAAEHALAQVADRLGSASSWSTYDTFFGGGVIGSAVKHNRLDEAAMAAAHADQRLAVLKTELADVRMTGPSLRIGELTRFVDVWFDNIFTDLAVRDRIKQAQENVARVSGLVRDLNADLQQRAAGVRARLAAIEAERRDLLT
jgi:DNA repair exonuclease SbcCD ATPase subunit